jgi:NlpC/P60 family
MAGDAAAFIAAAEALIGRPYVYGAAGPSAFDCSGLVQAAAAKAGFTVPRVSSEQYAAGVPVTADRLQPGDLVFSEWPGDDVPHHGHVAIYVGGGQIIQAPHPGGVVERVALDADYLQHVDGYARPAPLAGGASATASNASFLGDLGAGVGGVLSGLGNSFGDISGLVGAAYSSLTAAFAFFQAFFRPSTYIRIGAGLFGFVFVIVGLVFLGREARGSAA